MRSPDQAHSHSTKRVRSAKLTASMKRAGDIIYLTRKEWDAFKEQEHQERLALRRRVERGELTPEEANREASIFKDEVFNPAQAQTVNLDEMLANAAKLRFPRKAHARRKQKTVRA